MVEKTVTQEGSLNPVLYRLVDLGLITDRKVQVGKRMTRIYYHVESAGIQRLRELAREYEEVTCGVLQIVKRVVADADGDTNTALSSGGCSPITGQMVSIYTPAVEDEYKAIARKGKDLPASAKPMESELRTLFPQFPKAIPGGKTQQMQQHIVNVRTAAEEVLQDFKPAGENQPKKQNGEQTALFPGGQQEPNGDI